ncbi:hypothetical protein FACS189427_03350 [Planctomycetales bacterium]|nr:hypothetical protein FACS189427_03350 [Planctomycetales bacterium]
MGRFSKDKGKRGERELAGELTRVLGITARRGVQFQGSPDSPDVITDLPDIHIECKRTERFQLYKALEQAITDAGENKIPVVCHRQNNQPWVVVIRLNDIPKFINTFSEIKATVLPEWRIQNNERTDPSRDSACGHCVQCRNAGTDSD